jgi:hypothetical protein
LVSIETPPYWRHSAAFVKGTTLPETFLESRAASARIDHGNDKAAGPEEPMQEPMELAVASMTTRATSWAFSKRFNLDTVQVVADGRPLADRMDIDIESIFPDVD